ncbi:MAG: hypothetical protein RMJ48_21830 [Roseiflexaceae bacterium]|nr:hypothetical protein [Roseiflexaceae bacterium]
MIIVAREANLDDVLALERRPGTAWLIRAAPNRNVTPAARSLGDAGRAAPVQRRRTRAVGRPPLRAPRAAQ